MDGSTLNKICDVAAVSLFYSLSHFDANILPGIPFLFSQAVFAFAISRRNELRMEGTRAWRKYVIMTVGVLRRSTSK
jgi:hypothetical protein